MAALLKSAILDQTAILHKTLVNFKLSSIWLKLHDSAIMN